MFIQSYRKRPRLYVRWGKLQTTYFVFSLGTIEISKRNECVYCIIVCFRQEFCSRQAHVYFTCIIELPREPR